MTSWRVVIATPTMPFLPYQTQQEHQIQALVDTALAHDAMVTLIAPCTRTAVERAGHLRIRSKFLLRPIVPTTDPMHREVITTWIESVASGASRFLLSHPWFDLLDSDQMPTTDAPPNLATAWSLWTSAFFSLLSQLSYGITVIHALGWQTSLVPAMARCIGGSVSSAVSVFSPGLQAPPERLAPEVRTLLRLPREVPSAATADTLFAWGLAYASAWDLSEQEYQSIATNPWLADLLERHRAECLLPQDPASETLEHPALTLYAQVLVGARSLTSMVP